MKILKSYWRIRGNWSLFPSAAAAKTEIRSFYSSPGRPSPKLPIEIVHFDCGRVVSKIIATFTEDGKPSFSRPQKL